MRVDPSDGKGYPFASFPAVYGVDAPRLWRLAAPMASASVDSGALKSSLTGSAREVRAVDSLKRALGREIEAPVESDIEEAVTRSPCVRCGCGSEREWHSDGSDDRICFCDPCHGVGRACVYMRTEEDLGDFRRAVAMLAISLDKARDQPRLLSAMLEDAMLGWPEDPV